MEYHTISQGEGETFSRLSRVNRHPHNAILDQGHPAMVIDTSTRQYMVWRDNAWRPINITIEGLRAPTTAYNFRDGEGPDNRAYFQ